MPKQNIRCSLLYYAYALSPKAARLSRGKHFLQHPLAVVRETNEF